MKSGAFGVKPFSIITKWKKEIVAGLLVFLLLLLTTNPCIGMIHLEKKFEGGGKIKLNGKDFCIIIEHDLHE